MLSVIAQAVIRAETEIPVWHLLVVHLPSEGEHRIYRDTRQSEVKIRNN